MRSRRRIRLICRWAGVVILVVWGSTFVRRLVIAWDCTVLGGTGSTRSDVIEFDSGLIVFHDDRYIYGPVRWSCGIHLADPFDQTADAMVYMLGRYERRAGSTIFTPRVLIIPATIPIALSAFLVWYGFRRLYSPGCCQNCGYDLTGIADKCPECGRAVKESAA